MRINYKKCICIIVLLSVWSLVYFTAYPQYSKIIKNHVLALLVDKENSLSTTDQLKNAHKYLSNLPLEYWLNNTNKKLELNETCAKFPSLFDIQFQNLYWQNLYSSYGHYQMFGAYLDNRIANRLGPTVRILAMVNQIEPLTRMYCQIWFHNRQQPVIVQALQYDLCWPKYFGNYKTGIYQPYLIPYKIPSEYHNLTVAAVPLVENQCDTATNALTVFYNKRTETKLDFAICVKGMNFLLEDISSILTEWIEMMTLLGAHKIFLYNFNVHPNVSKVLKYYEDQGRVEVIPLTLPAGQPNTLFWQHIYLENKVMNKFQGEIIPYNDCLYKHMYEYKHIVLVDTDEVIVPLNGSTWQDLLSYLRQAAGTKYDSYNARNVYVFTDLLFTHKRFNDVPEYMHILNHIRRDPKIEPPGYYIKSFHNTETVLSLHNHFPVYCLHGSKHFTNTVHVSQVKVYRNHQNSEKSSEETDGVNEELDLERDASEQPEAAGAIYVEELTVHKTPSEQKRMKWVSKYLSDFVLD
ncbi:hypothetical protein RN001_011050 [Aquatica leii]|uniref:Glycosyltransferase family 92 protein n=1 Tax=Aquatica leii TaxID=1421715 RepID=A0AAN7P7J2_9COLE|nr:hypothetical protein RN001_011050 [Aquatica leii]